MYSFNRFSLSLLFSLVFVMGYVNSHAQDVAFDWAKSITGNNTISNNCITTDISGNVYVGGWMRDTVDFDPGPGYFPLICTGNSAGFITKLDSSGNFIWAKILTGISGSGAAVIGLTTDSLGKVYVTGGYSGKIDFNPDAGSINRTALGNNDIFIMRFAWTGTMDWVNTFGSTGVDNGRSIKIDHAGDVIVGGEFNGVVDFDPSGNVHNLTSQGSLDGCIAKYDALGNYIWAHGFGGSSTDDVGGVYMDQNNNIYVGGRYRNTIDFDPGPGTISITSNGSNDGYLAKYNSAGNALWATTFGGIGGWDYVNDVTVDSSGNVFACGLFRDTVDFDPGAGVHNLMAFGTTDAVVYKLDSGGIFQWAANWGGTYAITNSIVCDNQGFVYVSGYMTGDSLFVGTGANTDTLLIEGAEASALIKFNNSGSLVFAKQTVGGSDVGVSQITLTPENQLYMVGAFQDTCVIAPSEAAFPLISTGVHDGFILKFRPSCLKTYGSVDTIVCGSYTGPSALYTWFMSGTYSDTLFNSNAHGCDSIIQINLTVDTATYDTISPSVCNNYLSPDGAFYWDSTGVYIDTLTNHLGCDSIITINLTILEKGRDTVSVAACDSYASPSGNYVWTNSGTYSDTLSNGSANSCDSIVTINLTINPFTYDTIFPVVCGSYTAPSGNYVWSMSGNYNDTLPNANQFNCDSIITIDLTVNDTTMSSMVVSSCYDYTSPSGNHVWSTTGIYSDTLFNANTQGCDSILLIDLTIDTTTFGTISPIVCAPYASPSGNHIYTTAGTFIDTIPNGNGCDSIITINLSFGSPADTINVFACDDYTVPSGDETYNSSGTYQDTIPSTQGCDSLITINLTIGNHSADTLIITACDSYTIPSGNATHTNSGLYFDTLANAIGCDSLLVINLNIVNGTIGNLTVSECGSYTVPSGNYTYNSTGTYSDTISNQAGCDSIISINLTIHSPTGGTQTIQACDSFTVAGSTYYTSGTYSNTLQNSNGCDSLLTTILTISSSTVESDTVQVCIGASYTYPDGTLEANVLNEVTHTSQLVSQSNCDSVIHTTLTPHPVYLINENDTICSGESYTWPDGLTETNISISQTYTSNLVSSVGCDSTINTNLEVVNLNPGISQDMDMLFYHEPVALGTTFEWFLCGPPMTPLLNTNSAIYVPVVNGLYAVSVSYAGCTDTSGCASVTNVGLPKIIDNRGAILYPNPTQTEVYLQLPLSAQALDLQLYDIRGRLVKEVNNLMGTTIQISVSDLDQGVYILTAVEAGNHYRFRLIVQ